MTTTKEARKFISAKITKLRHEGKPAKAAVAQALSQARQKGFDVPMPSHIKKAEKRG